MLFAHHLGMLRGAERELASALRTVAEAHGDEPDVATLCTRFAAECDAHAEALEPFAERHGHDEGDDEPERLHSALFRGPREGPAALVRDLHDLSLMATEADIVWTLLAQAAQGARDAELLALVHRSEQQTADQLRWMRSRMKQAAPQALVVAR